MRKVSANFTLASFMVISGVSVAAAQECTPEHQFDTLVPGTLTVSVPTYQPFAMLNDDGTVGGVDGEILKEFARRNCLEIDAVATDAGGAIQYVVSGRSDVTMGDWMRTPSRDSVVGLSAPLYLDPMGIASADGIATVEELIGRSVGTVQGYNWNADLEAVLGGDLKLYPNSSAVSRDLEAGRIDVGIDGYASMVYAQAQGGLEDLEIVIAEPDERVPFTAEPGQAGIPYTKGNEPLGAALDAAIASMHEDGMIASVLSDYGLSAEMADVGEPRLTGN